MIKSIVSGEYYDEYGVCDPMKDLFEALIFTQEEKLEIADLIFESGSEFMKRDGAQLYKECGQTGKYYAFVEECLNDKEAPYMELIDYYMGVDPRKAVEIAEQGLKKCRDDQTDLIIFLLKVAVACGDKEWEAKLLKSARLRQKVNTSKVMEFMFELVYLSRRSEAEFRITF